MEVTRSQHNEATQWKSATHKHTDTQHCYKSFCLPLSSLESPIFFLLFLAGELSVATQWGGVSWKTRRDMLPMSPDRFLSSELKVVDDSTLERLIAESANDNGTVTERLLDKSEPCWLAMWDAVLSSGTDAVDSVANLQHATTAIWWGFNGTFNTN